MDLRYAVHANLNPLTITRELLGWFRDIRDALIELHEDRMIDERFYTKQEDLTVKTLYT